jgi:hypothetical protein
MPKRAVFPVVFGLLVGMLPWQGLRAEPDTAKPVSFMNDIAPLLKEACFACHDAKKRKGKLDLTTFAGLAKGGERGDAIVPGKPEESLLWTLASGEEEPLMPPKDAGTKLAPDRLSLIERWIKQGAKFDGTSPTENLVVELRRRWQPPEPPQAYPHPSAVRALAFTPDGKFLLAGGHHEILVHALPTGHLVQRLRTRAERTNAMMFLLDGKTLAVAGGRPGQEGDVRLYAWDPPPSVPDGTAKAVDATKVDGQRVRELLQIDDEVMALALSSDGLHLAAAGCDRPIRVWNTADWKQTHSIENHADWVFGLAFTPDGKRLVSVSRDKTAKVWDLATNEAVMTFPDHQNTVYGVWVRADGKQAFSVGEDGTWRSWSLENGKQVRAERGHTKPVFRIAAVTVQKRPTLATTSADGTVRLWNPDNGQTVKALAGWNDWVYALAVSPDGSQLAAGAWNGEIRVWRVVDGKDVAEPVAAFNASPGLKSASKK